MTLQNKYLRAGQAFIADLKVSSKSKATYEKYSYVVNSFGKYLNGTEQTNYEEVSPTLITGWKQMLAENGAKSNTIAHYLICLRSFFRWTVSQGVFTEQPIKEEMLPVMEEVKHDIPTLEEIELLLSGRLPKHTPRNKACKELAIITLLLESGIRVSELCNLRIRDLDFENNLVHIWNGKGSKERYAPFPERSQRRIKRFLEERRHGFLNEYLTPTSFVFPQEEKEDKPISRQGVLKMVESYVERLTGHKGIGAHDLRHAAASVWDERGVKIRDVQKALGHSSVQTTERIYVQILDKKKAAMTIAKAMST